MTFTRDKLLPHFCDHDLIGREYDISVISCTRCGALVRDDDAELHTAWHNEVDPQNEDAVGIEQYCRCGHRRFQHIYHEGACRSGVVVCSCDSFTLVSA